MTKQAKGSVSSFSRGAELWMHQTRLVIVSVLTATLISVAVGLLSGAVWFYWRTEPQTRSALMTHFVARSHHFLVSIVTFDVGQKKIVSGPAQKLANTISTSQRVVDGLSAEIRNSTIVAGLGFVMSFLLLNLFWWHHGRSKMMDDQIRGASIVSAETLSKMIASRDGASLYRIGGVPMRAGSENLNTLCVGAQGVGKSQVFFQVMRQVRDRGKRAIVYDPTGEYIEAFYREGQDVILNPSDLRCKNWNVWREISEEHHFDALANGLIPDPAESDPFWAKAGRHVLKDAYKVLGREGRRSNRDLYDVIAKSNLETLHTLLEGEAGATYVDPITERTGMSLKMTVQNQLESFRFLPDEGDPFSMRDWMKEEADSWVFISCKPSMREAIKPVMSLWLEVAIKASLDLAPLHRERLWLFLDELPTLQKLDSLPLLLTNGRKYGVCAFAGVQDLSQFYSTYGVHVAKTLISGCQTKCLLRVTDGAEAKLLSEAMGNAEVDEKQETLSYGLAAQRDGVSVMPRRNLRDLVLASEILRLPDMTGYLIVPGDYPVAKVSFDFVPPEKLVPGFVQRSGFDISFSPVFGTSTEDPFKDVF